MRKMLQLAVLGAVIGGSGTSYACLTANGPWTDSGGYKEFAFTNSCPDDVTAFVCVTSYPNGPDSAPVYNPVSNVISANSDGDVQDGLAIYYYDYTWGEGPVDCP